MAWAIGDDAVEFLDAAVPFLSLDAAAHAPLLTEAAYLASRPQPGARFGVWDGAVPAAFVHVPRHPVLLSALPAEPVELVAALPAALPWEVRVEDVAAVAAALVRERGASAEAARIVVMRVAADAVLDPTAVDPEGAARVATGTDGPLLAQWYGTLLASLDDDATDLAFLVDEPLSYAGALLWLNRGEPVGVAIRTRVAGGVTKVTAAWSPVDDRYAEAAFVAACAAARAVADHVVAMARPGSAIEERYRALGLVPAAERVLLR
ncbi:MAG TPA: hypothetical protein VFL59_16575 [Candidatus Nanopelagicales bacterium]|nr:hypothetical protein [Candidatus Nanopelagicales bacterium]